MVTASIVIAPGFNSFIFVAYYPALVLFALVFTSVWLGLAWTTMATVAYSVVSLSLGSGLDRDAGDEKVLVARLAAMCLLVLGVCLITRFERIRRRTAVNRERSMLQERIEVSQRIHDTAAQTAYMIGMGIDRAMRLADGSNRELLAALDATNTLSKEAMWELRHPIDAGRIFEDRELGRVLRMLVYSANLDCAPAERRRRGARRKVVSGAWRRYSARAPASSSSMVRIWMRG